MVPFFTQIRLRLVAFSLQPLIVTTNEFPGLK